MAALGAAESGAPATPPPPAHGSVSSSLPPNRGLERALEEAALSGVLNISGRKLKDFPRTVHAHDLSDTVEADLSRNRLADVPSDLCYLVAMETLNLYHNCIRTVPDGIISLQSLTSLNLSRNQLCSLPSSLCALPLRVLNASNNKLVSLPDNIRLLQGLMELDVSCNEITALPPNIGRLKSLRELNVRRNFLCVLPEELADLPLVKLDFSCNKVSTVPVCFRKMKQLQSLQLENNPLQSPPAQICLKGTVHIFKYLSLEACRCDKMADSLFLPVIERLSQSQSGVSSVEELEHQRKQDSDSGVGSDNGEKRLSATEPSDEDSVSLNLPMSHITEEEGISKEDSSEHISCLLADPHPDSVAVMEDSPTETLKDQFSCRDSALSSRFINYIKGRSAAALFEEPLRIEEDSPWQQQLTPGSAHQDQDQGSGVHLFPLDMVTTQQDQNLNGQDSDDVTAAPKQPVSDCGHEFQKKRRMILEKAQRACREYEWHMSVQREQPSPGGHSSVSSPPFGLRPRSAPPSLPCSPPPSYPDPSPLSQATPLRRDTGRSRDDGDVDGVVFLRSVKGAETVDPQFTMRRRMEQLREELELMEHLRDSIQSRLKVILPEDLGSSLMDGVVLCHLANHIRPRSVGSIHVPSPAVPRLSMAKCRRNVENFLDACRRIGVAEDRLCLPHHILEDKGLLKVSITVQALVDQAS